MHRGYHHHSHSHDHDHDHGDHDHDHHHDHGLGHNAMRRPAQWQTPHDPAASEKAAPAPEPDFDLVETAFITGFLTAPDPVSFLRLARVPLMGRASGGETLHLLRVETDEAVDVASITPHLGGTSMRHDPLPPRMVSRRRRLAFIYFDGQAARRLSFAEALALLP